MSDSSMHDLAARLARGEEAAFAELYDACADRLHHYLAERLGSREAASDVLQSAFLRAVKSRKRFRGVENPVAYMFQIARNEALRASKKQRDIRNAMPERELFAAAGEIESDEEDTEVVALALSRLNADDREIIELKIFAGLTFREIADVVGMPQGTVATRYRRALESLRGWLAKQFR
ncbi:MAG TPA: sigma-70 family RNA polymerase sigma factor [Lacipirellulaceae bacterium]|nr:sigma-70 family RNA polymerase sigma factor [Lacipirellulaceae bacterium]